MKKMSRMIALILALLLALSVGCGYAEEDITDAEENIAEPVVDSSEPESGTAAEEDVAGLVPLEPGMTGEEVTALNATLTLLGYLDGELSEEYGEATEAAVRAFQLQAGLAETGIADVDTRTAMLAEDAPVNPDNPPEGEQVWIPKSGEKYHSKWDCGTMKAPTCVSLEEAEAMGYTPCSRCYKADEAETEAEAQEE